MRGLLEFLTYSNVYLAIGAGLVSLTTSILVFSTFRWELFYIPFSAGFLIYNFNRFTDLSEDTLNVPKRALFTRKYGKTLLWISAIAYLIALAIALRRNAYTFLVVITPLILAFFYSFFRVKKFLVIKNILVSFAWALSVLIVAAFFEVWNKEIFLLCFFFFLGLLINTIIFDIKDIKGDRIHKIKTLPVVIGINKTKKVCYMILLSMFFVWLLQFSISFWNLLLLPFIVYVFSYIYFADEKRPWWYFGVFVDGEFFTLLPLLIIFSK